MVSVATLARAFQAQRADLFFCVSGKPSITVIIRMGWRADPPDGWVQRGPPPRSVQWLRASQQSRQVAGQSQPRQQPKPKPVVVKTSGTRPFGDSQRVAAAEERVTKLESALAALHGVEGPEVDTPRAALKQAREVKEGVPLDVQITQCEGFLSRARAHPTELDASLSVPTFKKPHRGWMH